MYLLVRWRPHLTDADCWQSLAGRVPVGGDLVGPRRGGAAPSGPLQGDGAVRAAAGAGGRPPPDEGDLHRGVRPADQWGHF